MFQINLIGLVSVFNRAHWAAKSLHRTRVSTGGLVVLVLVGMMGSATVRAVNFNSDTRSVAISVTAPTPPALGSTATQTNTPVSPFGNPVLQASGQIEWESVEDWTPQPTLASATQSVLFSADEIRVSVDLVAQVGGDPYGVRYAAPYSGEAIAASHFAVGFSVDSPTTYEYAFDFGVNSTLQNVDLRLTSLNGLDLPLYSTAGFSQSGDITLMPGEDYMLMFAFSCHATGDKFGSSSSELVISMEAVPEPQVSALLTLGGMLILWARRHSVGRCTRN